MITTHAFRVAQARRISHPTHNGIEKHIFLMRCNDVPEGLSKDANARDFEGRDLNKRVYRDIGKTLLGEMGTPGTFDLLNKGITVIAQKVNRVNDNEFTVTTGQRQGIADGGHTYDILCSTRKKADVPDDQFVEVRVFTGVPDVMIPEIAMGLNTGVQVKDHSLDFLAGKYDWLQEDMRKAGWDHLFAWRESDAAPYDVRDLISTLEALNVFDYPNGDGAHPVTAYEKWSAPAKRFAADCDRHLKTGEPSTYQRLRPLLREALVLMDHIKADFKDAYNDEIGGRAAALDIVESAKRDDFTFPFADLPSMKHRLTKGPAYAIFAALRNLVEVDQATGDARWAADPVAFWNAIKPLVVRTVRQAIEDYGHKPDVLGKSRGFWNQMHQTIELHLLRARAANQRVSTGSAAVA